MISTVTKVPTARRPIDETDLCGWIGQAAPGEALEYYRGFLAMDTFSQGTRLTEPERAELKRVARRAWSRARRRASHERTRSPRSTPTSSRSTRSSPSSRATTSEPIASIASRSSCATTRRAVRRIRAKVSPDSRPIEWRPS